MEEMMQHLNDLPQEERSRSEWEQEHLKEGRYTLNMVKIDRKVRDVIKPYKTCRSSKRAYAK